MPVRIQRRRTRGWRMPAGAVYVGRPTRFGNPWHIGDTGPAGDTVDQAAAVALYAAHLNAHPELAAAARTELAGAAALACWCPLDQPCHADVLIQSLTAAGQEES